MSSTRGSSRQAKNNVQVRHLRDRDVDAHPLPAFHLRPVPQWSSFRLSPSSPMPRSWRSRRFDAGGGIRSARSTPSNRYSRRRRPRGIRRRRRRRAPATGSKATPCAISTWLATATSVMIIGPGSMPSAAGRITNSRRPHHALALDLDLLLDGLKPVIRGLNPRDVNALTAALLQEDVQGQGPDVAVAVQRTSSFSSTMSARRDQAKSSAPDRQPQYRGENHNDRAIKFSGAIEHLQRLVTDLSARPRHHRRRHPGARHRYRIRYRTCWARRARHWPERSIG